MNKKIKDIIRIAVSAICYIGILSLSNVIPGSGEYWIIVLLLIIQSIAWGIK